MPAGSTYGLIGSNGSGKSTLLKLMANIHRPTSGTITHTGRISALLELGAGFHPELSGRDNVYLNGSILGMTRKQVDAAMDAIIDFSGIEEFIDTPVKVYSSGMYVRLGFSIAVNLDPEILIIDEIIAVGDEEFQRRCFDYLYELRKRGVTIIFVSHSLPLVQTLCDRAAWIEKGVLRAEGSALEVVDEYISTVNKAERVRLDSEGHGRSDGDVETTGWRRSYRHGRHVHRLRWRTDIGGHGWRAADAAYRLPCKHPTRRRGLRVGVPHRIGRFGERPELGVRRHPQRPDQRPRLHRLHRRFAGTDASHLPDLSCYY